MQLRFCITDHERYFHRLTFFALDILYSPAVMEDFNAVFPVRGIWETVKFPQPAKVQVSRKPREYAARHFQPDR